MEMTVNFSDLEAKRILKYAKEEGITPSEAVEVAILEKLEDIDFNALIMKIDSEMKKTGSFARLHKDVMADIEARSMTKSSEMGKGKPVSISKMVPHKMYNFTYHGKRYEGYMLDERQGNILCFSKPEVGDLRAPKDGIYDVEEIAIEMPTAVHDTEEIALFDPNKTY